MPNEQYFKIHVTEQIGELEFGNTIIFHGTQEEVDEYTAHLVKTGNERYDDEDVSEDDSSFSDGYISGSVSVEPITFIDIVTANGTVPVQLPKWAGE